MIFPLLIFDLAVLSFSIFFLFFNYFNGYVSGG